MYFLIMQRSSETSKPQDFGAGFRGFVSGFGGNCLGQVFGFVLGVRGLQVAEGGLFTHFLIEKLVLRVFSGKKIFLQQDKGKEKHCT